jgi:regulator of sigma E protease
MNSVIIFILVLGVLIFFHELGHFLVARSFGVGVEKFSLGFGPRIFGKTIGRTDYRISLIPLGGYVKMVGDEPDADLEPQDIPFSFTHKHVAKRSLIVVAGPFFNILLAIIIFTIGLYFTGLPSIRPVIRNVESDGPAFHAGIAEGDRIQAINNTAVESWRDIDAAVEHSQGRTLNLHLKRGGETLAVAVTPREVHAKNVFGDDITYYDLGISGLSEMTAIVDDVVAGMPADKAGLKKGDRIVAIDGQPIDRWEAMQEIVSKSKGRALKFRIQRGAETFQVDIVPSQVQERDLLGAKQNVYRIGIRRPGMTVPSEDRITVELNAFQALGQGLRQTWDMTEATGYFFIKLVQRKVPVEAIGGPIRIAQMAQKEAQQGILQLFYFIAIISINLAVLNVLPIPVLDGGHLLFYLIEAIQRRPVGVRTRETAQQIGIFILLLLMVFVFYNDITLTFFK